MNVYSVPDAKMIILYQSGQTRIIFAFLMFKSLSSHSPSLGFRLNFIVSAFLVVVVLTAFLTETKRFAFSVVGLVVVFGQFLIWHKQT